MDNPDLTVYRLKKLSKYPSLAGVLHLKLGDAIVKTPGVGDVKSATSIEFDFLPFNIKPEKKLVLKDIERECIQDPLNLHVVYNEDLCAPSNIFFVVIHCKSQSEYSRMKLLFAIGRHNLSGYLSGYVTEFKFPSEITNEAWKRFKEY